MLSRVEVFENGGSASAWTGKNGGLRKRLFSYPFSVVKCGRSKTLQKR